MLDSKVLDSDVKFRKELVEELRGVISKIEEYKFFLEGKKKKVITPIKTSINHLKQFEL